MDMTSPVVCGGFSTRALPAGEYLFIILLAPQFYEVYCINPESKEDLVVKRGLLC
jgi:hypothetical protein